MIIADDFLWLHLPKTGGTSMNRLFRERELVGVRIDSDQTAEKHDSVTLRESRGSWRAGSRRRFITARRLDAWLVSDWEHKRRYMGVAELDFAPVRSGLFYSLRLGGIWVAADWWLEYFDVDHSTIALRLEHLREDLNRQLLPLLPSSTEAFTALPRDNSKPSHLEETTTRFTYAEGQQIKAVNPRWSAWEASLYENNT